MNPVRRPLLERALHAGMGGAVLDFLRQRQALPDQGIVAGQAVASALLALWGDDQRQGPVNDVDVFLPVTQAQAYQRETEARARTERNPSVDIRGESTRASGSNTCRHLRIAHTGDDGLLNLVEICADADPLRPQEHCVVTPGSDEWHLFPDGITALDVIRTFDFNAVACGIDLRDGALVWLPEFERFVQTGGELEIMDRSSPQTTLARLLKKTSEMPWLACDRELLAQQCISGMRALWIQRNGLGMPAAHAATFEKLDPQHHYPWSHEHWTSTWQYENRYHSPPLPIGQRLGIPRGWEREKFLAPLQVEQDRLLQPEFWRGLCKTATEFVGRVTIDADKANPLTACNIDVWRMDALYALQHPLHAATADATTRALQTLLDDGADPNVRDHYGRTPAHWAVALGHIEHLEALAGAGADFALRDRSDHSVMDVASWMPEMEPVTRALWARAVCQSEIAEWLTPACLRSSASWAA